MDSAYIAHNQAMFGAIAPWESHKQNENTRRSGMWTEILTTWTQVKASRRPTALGKVKQTEKESPKVESGMA